MNCLVVVLAAGKGTRMKSDLPKVLHEASGRALLDDPEEMQGVNTREDLRSVEQVFAQRLEN